MRQECRQTLTQRRGREFPKRRLSDCLDHAAALYVALRASGGRR